MKAIVYTEYGGPEVLKMQDVEKPSPKGNEILIRVRAVSVNYGDLIARNYKDVSPKGFDNCHGSFGYSPDMCFWYQ